MSAESELMADIRSAPCEDFRQSARDVRATAAHLIAEGWTKPREVRTADELDALPVGSVVIDVDGEPWKKLRPNLWASRDSCEESSTVFWTHSEIHPTVLHEPGEGHPVQVRLA